MTIPDVFRATPSTIGRSSLTRALLALLAVLISSAFPAHAETPSTSLTVEQFLARIDGRLPELTLLDAEVHAARADVAEARRLAPIGISYEHEEVFSGGEGIVQKSGLSIGWSVDPSGRRGQRIRSAEHRVEATRKQRNYDQHLVVVRALALYYETARAKLRAASLRESRAPLAGLVTKLQHRVGEGDASGYDLARFQLALSEHEDRLAAAEAQYSTYRLRLAALVGEHRGVEPSDALDLPAAPGPTAPASRGDLQATSDLDSSGKALMRAAGRWWIPSLDLSLGYMNTDLGPGSGPGADLAHGYSAMVTASLPLFSRGKAEKQRGEALARRAQATRSVLVRRVNVEVEVSRELLRSRIARSRAFASKQLVQVQRLVRSAESAYHGGEATALELRDAYRQATDAQLRHIDLRFQSRLAQLELWKATGALPSKGIK